MTKDEVKKVFEGWYDEWLRQRSPYVQSLSEEKQLELWKALVWERIKAEDPELEGESSEGLLKMGLKNVVHKMFEEDAPNGEYDSRAWVPVEGEDEYVMMNRLTKEQLSWFHMLLVSGGGGPKLDERAERNVRYVISRRGEWEKHPECKTLGQLEAVLQEAMQ